MSDQPIYTITLQEKVQPQRITWTLDRDGKTVEGGTVELRDTMTLHDHEAAWATAALKANQARAARERIWRARS